MLQVKKFAAEDLPLDRGMKVAQAMTRSFVAHYRIDPDDAWSEAMLGFVRAIRSFDADRMAFTSWVGEKVKRALMSLLRRKVEEARRRGPLAEEPAAKETPRFDAEYFLSTLTDDAKTLVLAVFRPPMDVRVTMAEMGRESAVNFRTALRIFLADCGWEPHRVDAAFREVRSKL